MFAIKKNQVIITALVAMIAAAGYLNYISQVWRCMPGVQLFRKLRWEDHLSWRGVWPHDGGLSQLC